MSAIDVPTCLSVQDEKYGWKAANAACSVAYVWPLICAELRRIRANTVLDLGSGNGAMTRLLSDAGFDVVGFDPDEDGVRIASESAPSVRFERIGVYDDPSLWSESFDAVVSSEVVEHLMYPDYLPRFANHVMRPGGRLILTTPFHGYLKNLAICATGKWDAHHNPLRNGWHVKFWSVKTLSALVEREDFEVEKVQGRGRPYPFWKSMILTAVKN